MYFPSAKEVDIRAFSVDKPPHPSDEDISYTELDCVNHHILRLSPLFSTAKGKG